MTRRTVIVCTALAGATAIAFLPSTAFIVWFEAERWMTRRNREVR